jgi:hypothetical protein
VKRNLAPIGLLIARINVNILPARLNHQPQNERR